MDEFNFNVIAPQFMRIDLRGHDDKQELFDHFDNVLLVHLISQNVRDDENHTEKIVPLGSVIFREDKNHEEFEELEDTRFFDVYCSVRDYVSGEQVEPALNTSLALTLDKFADYVDSTESSKNLLFFDAKEFTPIMRLCRDPDMIGQEIVDVVTNVWCILRKMTNHEMVVAMTLGGYSQWDDLFSLHFDNDDDTPKKKKKNKKKKNK